MLKIYATPCRNDPIILTCKQFMTCKNLTSASLVCFLLSESTQAFDESIQSVNFVRKLSIFTLYYIYTSLHNFKIIESFATILSRSQKLIVHTFFNVKHFFLESLCSLSVQILQGSSRDCKLVLSRRLIELNQGFKGSG